jgi:glucose-1-phosphate adenylyltransferase
MERVILLPGRARTSRTLSRKPARRMPTPEPRAWRPEGVDVRDAITVVLGGGRGNRLFPLTQERCKPAVPVGGTYRLVDISISNSINSGIDRVFVLTQFNSASLNSHIAHTYRLDSFGRGYVEILAAEQTEASSDWYQGTADAVRKQLHRIRATGAKEVVILSGDHLYRMDLRAFLARHRESRADITVGVTPVARADASQFGLLRVDEDDMIAEFAEKPKDPAAIERFTDRGGEHCLGSMGIYVFKIDVLSQVLEDPAALDFGMHVLPRAIRERPIAAHRFDGYWEDLGTISSYHKANVALAAGGDGFDFFSGETPIYARPRLLPASRIDGACLRGTLVPDGCIIEEGAELRSSVLGPRTVIGRGSRLEQCVVFGATRYESPVARPRLGVGERCTIKNAIIDEDARIGDGVVLENRAGVRQHDGVFFYVREGIVIVPRGATVAANFTF